jgi:hypothetical protein
MMFLPYKKERFATVAIIFAVFFFIAPQQETFVVVFAIHDTIPHVSTVHMLLLSHSFIIVSYFIAERELSLTFQVVVLSSKILVLFPQDKGHQQCVVAQVKASKTSPFSSEMEKSGHWLETSKDHPWSCQSKLHPADPEFSGTECFPEAHTLESGVLRARLIHGSSHVSQSKEILHLIHQRASISNFFSVV